MIYNINGKDFKYISNYRDNEELRTSFYELAKKVFGLDFQTWHDEGFWTKNYNPCSLVCEGRVVANISVNFMEFNYLGENRHYIQLGTVMTDPEYRKLGLSRILLDKVIAEWQEKCDCMFLFANDTVVEYYPKFGFKKVAEYQHSIAADAITLDKRPVRKLNPYDLSDRRLLVKRSNGKNPLAVLSTEHNAGITMFYCLSIMKEMIYYIEELDAVAIAEYDGDKLIIHDVYCPEGVRLSSVASSLLKPDTKRVVFGFTPMDSCDCDEEELHAEDTTLFVINNNENIFWNEHVMFPEMSHA